MSGMIMQGRKAFLARTGVVLGLTIAGLGAPPAAAQTTVPGVTDGALAVDANGAAGYSIPIAVPPGIAGMAPDLSLNYSSNGGNGVLGMGWSLGGLSVVFRCPRTLAQDGAIGGVNFDANDRFCLDGQRLVAVSGAYGADGTEYRTEIESFTKVVSYGAAGSGPDRFKAWTKSGQVIEYGFTADSQADVQNQPEVRFWAVSKISDTAGNYMTLSYSENAAIGDNRIDRIDYAGNAARGVAPFASVRFSYETRPDVSRHYQAGTLISTNERVAAIQTYFGESLVRDYRLAYDESPLTGRSRLTSVTECAANGDCLAPIQFAWREPAGTSGWQADSNYAPGYKIASDNHGDLGTKFQDVNGDGLVDHLYHRKPDNSSNPEKGAFLNTGSGWQANTAFTPPYVMFSDGSGEKVGPQPDANADRLADFLYHRVPDNSGPASGAYLSDGTGWVETPDYAPPYPLTADAHADMGTRYVDLDGDGRIDILQHRAPRSGPVESGASLNTGSGWVDAPAYTPLYGIWSNKKLDRGSRFIDVNGDGLVDHVYHLRGNNGGTTKGAYLNTGSGWVQDNSYAPPERIAKEKRGDVGTRFADVNGDGLVDQIFYKVGNNGGVTKGAYLSTGRGWVSAPEFTPPHPTYKETRPDQGARFEDVNGDGMVDLLYHRKPNNSAADPRAYLSTGTGWREAPAYAPLYHIVADSHPDSGARFVDVNGDGRVDQVYHRQPDNSSAPVKGAYINTAVPDHVISVTDSLGTQTTLTYAPLTDPAVYEKGSGAAFPVQDFQGPLYVVAEVSTDDGVGGQARTTYEYDAARFHLQGRGFLGFAFMHATDEQTGITTTTAYRQVFPFIGGIAASESYLADDTTVRTLVNTWASEPADGSVPVFPFVSQAAAESYEINDGPVGQQPVTVVTTDSTYDGFGNPTDIVTTTEGGGQSFTTTTTSTYDNDTANWFLGRLRRAEVEQRLPDGSASTRVSAFAYDPGTGLLSQEVIEPDRPALRLTTDYARDGFGNITETTVSGTDIATRSTKIFYSVDGRFAERTENALGHSETRTFDPGFGTVLGHIGPNGIPTSWEYDGFGRKTREDRADGTASIWDFNFNSYASIAYSARKREIRTDTGAFVGRPVVDYFDPLNRVTLQQTRGFDETSIFVDTKFTARGEVKKVSRPYFSGTPWTEKQWTTTAYDIVGRPVSVTAPDGGVTSTVYDGLTTTATNALDQVETRRNNAIGQLVQVTDNEGTTVTYTYDHHGNLVETDAGGVVTTMEYDIRGRKISMDDPDMGVWFYAYNVLGELVSQTDAKDQTVTMDYDKLGRMTLRTEPSNDTTTWTYDNPAKTAAIGKLTEVSRSEDDYAEDYTYDGVGRASETTITYEGLDYTTANSYDAAGRLDVLTYPHPVDNWTFAVEHDYTRYGYLKEVREAGGATVYWQAIEVDAEGRVVEERLGNNLTTFRDYDPADGLVRAIQTFQGLTRHQDLAFDFDLLGNLVARSDLRQGQGRTETFDYDGLNRLTSTTLTDTATQTQLGQTTYAYDALGNLTFKSDVGSYTYGVGAGPHAVTAAGNKSFAYDANGSMTSTTESGSPTRSVAWSSFNKPVHITAHTSLGTSDIVYGPDRARIKQTVVKGGSIKTITYAGGLLEKHSKSGTPDELVHYIRAGGTVAIFTRVVDYNANTNRTRYLHKDHLGSIDLITEENGDVAEDLSYDPHGKRRAADWQAGPVPTPTETHRGFTGHEHLDSVGLIHMGGRVYDPVIGRFLSADPFVQAPTNTQSFNRYSYVNNNPLSFTDPSGFFWKSLKKAFKKIGHFFMKTELGQGVAMVLIGLVSLSCGPYAGACALAGMTAYSTARSIANGNDVGSALGAAAMNLVPGGSGLGSFSSGSFVDSPGGDPESEGGRSGSYVLIAAGVVKAVSSALRKGKSRSDASVSDVAAPPTVNARLGALAATSLVISQLDTPAPGPADAIAAGVMAIGTAIILMTSSLDVDKAATTARSRTDDDDVITFYRGTTRGSLLEVVATQRFDIDRIKRNQDLYGLERRGVFLTSQYETARQFARLAGINNRGLGPGILRIEVPRQMFLEFVEKHNIQVETPIPRPLAPGQTETRIPYEAVSEFENFATFSPVLVNSF